MNEDFSGSCAVASRNSLLHNGATNATWSWRLDAEGVPPGRRGVLGAVLEGSLATANFGELLFQRLSEKSVRAPKRDSTGTGWRTRRRLSDRFWPSAPVLENVPSLFQTVSPPT